MERVEKIEESQLEEEIEDTIPLIDRSWWDLFPHCGPGAHVLKLYLERKEKTFRSATLQTLYSTGIVAYEGLWISANWWYPVAVTGIADKIFG